MSSQRTFSDQLSLGLRNAGWMFFDKIFRMATGLLVGIWLARYLGPAQFGLLNYVYIFPLMLSALVSLGINTLLSSEIPTAASLEEADRLLLTSIMLKVTAGMLAFGLIMGANFYMHHRMPQLLFLITISASGLLFQGFDAVDIYFQSIRKVHYSIIPKIIAFALATLVRLYGLINGLGLSFFVFIAAVELATGYVVIYFLYIQQRQVLTPWFSFSKRTAQKLLRASWPIMMAEFFIFMYMRLDQVMITRLAGNSELGKYSAALRISEAWYFVAAALTASFYPAIIALRLPDYRAYLYRYQSLLNLLVTLGLGIGLVFSILSEPLTQLLYGKQYAGVDTILSIHIWTGVFVFLGVGSNNWFIVEHLQTFLLGRTVIGALVNLALNIVLIPKYGAVGASVATLIAQFVASYMTNGFYHRTREVFRLQTTAIFFVPTFLNTYLKQLFSRINRNYDP